MKQILMATLLCLPGLASANTLCRFETECYEAEACAESGFDVQITLPEGPQSITGRLVAETDGGTYQGFVLKAGPTERTMFFDGETLRMMVTLIGTDARLAVHVTDPPAMVNYIGTCEAE
jgi:hypothetical protein